MKPFLFCLCLPFFFLLRKKVKRGEGGMPPRCRQPWFKCMHKATLRWLLLFWQQAVLSESYKDSNNLRMSFFFIKKSVKRCHISLGLLGIQTLYISNGFLILMGHYFIDTLESILKLLQGFWNTLFKGTLMQIWKLPDRFKFIYK